MTPLKSVEISSGSIQSIAQTKIAGCEQAAVVQSAQQVPATAAALPGCLNYGAGAWVMGFLLLAVTMALRPSLCKGTSTAKFRGATTAPGLRGTVLQILEDKE